MDDTYYFHQTPSELCKELIARTPLVPTDTILEPFAGENNFYNNFPAANPKDWAEITRNRDYQTITESFDWVITNPPFRLEQPDGKRVNSFYYLLDYYTTSNRIRKGVAFLGNDSCFSSLTPLRMKVLNEKGWFITSITTCNIKKWRGRYFYIIFERRPSTLFNYITGSY
jgi:hypothetical protein